MNDRADDWGQYLDAAAFATNTSVQGTTKYTPFRLMFGRNPRFPLEAEREEQSVQFKPTVNALEQMNIEEVVEKITERQQIIF